MAISSQWMWLLAAGTIWCRSLCLRYGVARLRRYQLQTTNPPSDSWFIGVLMYNMRHINSYRTEWASYYKSKNRSHLQSIYIGFPDIPISVYYKYETHLLLYFWFILWSKTRLMVSIFVLVPLVSDVSITMIIETFLDPRDLFILNLQR